MIRKVRQQPFLTSVVLHLLVLFCLFMVTVLQAFKPKEEPHVFVMVPPPASAVMPTDQPPNEVVDTLPDLPSVTPIQPEKLPEPEPRVVEPVQPVVPDVPAPPRAAVVEKVEPAKPKRELISADDFFKDRPRTQKTTTQTQRKVIEVPKIQFQPNFDSAMQFEPRSQDVPMTNAQINALSTYASKLNARLNQAWRRPNGLGGLELVVSVSFDVLADGRIVNVRLNPRSGNSVFDQSVLNAFKAVATGGPTPTRQPQAFTMDFRMAR